MTTQELNQEAVQAFAGKMVGVLNDAGLALMTSIGHQAGLFDTMAGLPPSTSASPSPQERCGDPRGRAAGRAASDPGA